MLPVIVGVAMVGSTIAGVLWTANEDKKRTKDFYKTQDEISSEIITGYNNYTQNITDEVSQKTSEFFAIMLLIFALFMILMVIILIAIASRIKKRYKK